MKKTMLWGALFTLICTQVQAEVTQQPAQPQAPGTVSAPVSNQEAPIQAIPNVQPGQPAQLQPTNQQPVQNIQNTQQTPAAQPQAAPVINCDYKVPTGTKTIDQGLVITWSEKAITQAFEFDPMSVDTQVQKLKACFTEQGWSGFNSALEKSGNVEAIKTQKLTVSSQVDGQVQVTEAKDNQWKITVPLHVVYQNEKEKVTQLLTISLTVNRKVNGDLGIAQMIATPRTVASPQQPVNAAAPTQPSNVNIAAPATTVNTGTPPDSTNNPMPAPGPATTNNPGTPH
jgi:hypothetical protein